MWWNTPVILTTQVAEIGGLQFKTSLDNYQDPISKTSQAWWYMPAIQILRRQREEDHALKLT
jgi:hypothetical protein